MKQPIVMGGMIDEDELITVLYIAVLWEAISLNFREQNLRGQHLKYTVKGPKNVVHLIRVFLYNWIWRI